MKVSGVLNKERFIALAIDGSIALILVFFIGIFIANITPVVKGVILVAIYLGYFIVFEGIWSRTPGKYYEGLIVRTIDGRKIGWRGALIRGFMIFFELNPLFLGGLPAGLVALTSERKQRLGDMLAGTVVVSDKLTWDSVADDKAEVSEETVAYTSGTYLFVKCAMAACQLRSSRSITRFVAAYPKNY